MSRVASDEIGRPSRRTSPAVGVSNRASARRTVDFPHPFGPTIVVTLPSGMARLRSRATGVPPYPTVMRSAASRGPVEETLMPMPFGCSGAAGRSGTAPRRRP